MTIKIVTMKCTKAVGDAFKKGQYYNASVGDDIYVENSIGDSYSLTSSQKHISDAGEYWFIVG